MKISKIKLTSQVKVKSFDLFNFYFKNNIYCKDLIPFFIKIHFYLI